MTQVIKLSCYIEEYNENGNLNARLRDKETDKKIVLVGKSMNKNHFLKFLSQVKINQNVMPTIFDKNGVDIVAVRGSVLSTSDEKIEICVDVPNGGYLFE